MATQVMIIQIAEGVAVEGFLIFSGALAMLVGLVALLEGNLHCFGRMQHKRTNHGRHAMRRKAHQP